MTEESVALFAADAGHTSAESIRKPEDLLRDSFAGTLATELTTAPPESINSNKTDDVFLDKNEDTNIDSPTSSSNDDQAQIVYVGQPVYMEIDTSNGKNSLRQTSPVSENATARTMEDSMSLSGFAALDDFEEEAPPPLTNKLEQEISSITLIDYKTTSQSKSKPIEYKDKPTVAESTQKHACSYEDNQNNSDESSSDEDKFEQKMTARQEKLSRDKKDFHYEVPHRRSKPSLSMLPRFPQPDINVANDSITAASAAAESNDSSRGSVHSELLRIKLQQEGQVPDGLIQVGVSNISDSNSNSFKNSNPSSLTELKTSLTSIEQPTFSPPPSLSQSLSQNMSEPLQLPEIYTSHSGNDFSYFGKANSEPKNNRTCALLPGAYRHHNSDYVSSNEASEDFVGTNTVSTEFSPSDMAMKEGPLEEGLAVAMPVNDNLVDAIEVDPNAKVLPVLTPKLRRRRYITSLLIFVAVTVTVGIALLVIFTRQHRINDDIVTQESITESERPGVQSTIEQIIELDQLQNPSSPYARALQWILVDDPLQLTSQNATLIQRYVAAYLYFAVTTFRPMRSCNPPENPWNDTSYCSYQQLINTGVINTYTPKVASPWLSSMSECSWAGIECDHQEQIISIQLGGFNLTGSFPEGIRYLPFLSVIKFTDNQLSGKLPSDLLTMNHIASLSLHINYYTGTIPTEWWTARRLTWCNLGRNQLEGNIPSKVGNLVDLKALYLFENKMTGTIPDEVGDVDSLTYFIISNNQFMGEVPQSVYKWNSIIYFWLHTNNFSGTISSEVGQWNRSLLELIFRENQFSGTIPDELYNLTYLERLELSFNGFSGSLSNSIGNLRRLKQLILTNNYFSGTIPDSIANLSLLTKVYLQGNDFTGTIPIAYCDLKGEGESLIAVEADCSTNANGVAEISCVSSCCSICCDADGLNCVSS